MKLIWHIAAKDMRRLAWPVALWLLLVVAGPVLLLRAGPSSPPFASDLYAIGAYVSVVMILQLVTGYMLAGGIVQQDVLVGTTTFWRTRPIAPLRLLTAKLLAAVLLFLVAPVLLLVPIWFRCSFTPADVLGCAWSFCGLQLVVLVPGLLVASLTRNAGHMFIASVVFLVAVMFCAGRLFQTPSFSQDLEVLGPVDRTLLLGLMVAGALVLLVGQYLGRKTWAIWAVLVAGLVALRFWGQVFPTGHLRFEEAPWPAAGVRPAELKVTWATVGDRPGSIEVRSGEQEGAYLAPVYGRGVILSAGREQPVVLRPLGEWGEEQLTDWRPPAALVWHLGMIRPDGRPLRQEPGPGRFKGELLFRRLHFTSFPDVAMQPGAMWRSGSEIRQYLGAERSGDTRWRLAFLERRPTSEVSSFSARLGNELALRGWAVRPFLHNLRTGELCRLVAPSTAEVSANGVTARVAAYLVPDLATEWVTSPRVPTTIRWVEITSDRMVSQPVDVAAEGEVAP
ncbi:hypothetical protein [Opitutus sp. ER46]|uniref:hypothetical protein n=1 Tax=Opitutus sp. ER46 TaxID=2161864 RepID=UPI000D30D6F5|nr:hypothetical protein [Opitutus sp. ER46]PTY00343.1 hypothetical protein DB354_01665 [Opitutus sp. ER46]